ncbi:MAG: hypothetical protein WC824_15890, partial [Bacteroidota bacterium]
MIDVVLEEVFERRKFRKNGLQDPQFMHHVKGFGHMIFFLQYQVKHAYGLHTELHSPYLIYGPYEITAGKKPLPRHIQK